MIRERVFQVARCLKLDEEGAMKWFRRGTLHSSCVGFGTDFAHECLGKAMIFANYYEKFHTVIISWSAFAAVLVVYIDDERHKLKTKPREERDAEIA